MIRANFLLLVWVHNSNAKLLFGIRNMIKYLFKQSLSVCFYNQQSYLTTLTQVTVHKGK